MSIKIILYYYIFIDFVLVLYLYLLGIFKTEVIILFNISNLIIFIIIKLFELIVNYVYFIFHNKNFF